MKNHFFPQINIEISILTSASALSLLTCLVEVYKAKEASHTHVVGKGGIVCLFWWLWIVYTKVVVS